MARTIFYAVIGTIALFVGLHFLTGLINLLVLVGILAGVGWLIVWGLRKVFGRRGKKATTLNVVDQGPTRKQQKRTKKILKQHRKAHQKEKAQKALPQGVDVNTVYIKAPIHVKSERVRDER